MGPKCEEVCPEGFYGSNCLEVCTCNRKPNFVCHPSHGCVCKAGWRGKNCDESIYSASTAEPEEGEHLFWIYILLKLLIRLKFQVNLVTSVSSFVFKT